MYTEKVLNIDKWTLKDGSIFMIGDKKYRINFSEGGLDTNIDLWDYQATKPLSLIGTISRDGKASFNGMLFHIDRVLN